ncbi:MAG: AbrB/MazE/SpoVT family DNA-binding domain-containing protein [Candidatus Hermodarchaeota archaeon]
MSKTLGVSKMTRNYQASIPPEVREDLGLKVGDFIGFIKDVDGKIYLKRI